MSDWVWLDLWPKNPEKLENAHIYPIIKLIGSYLDLEELISLMKSCKFLYWFILKNQLMINAIHKNRKKCKECYQKIGSCICYMKIYPNRIIENDNAHIVLSLMRSYYTINISKHAILDCV